MSSDMVTTRSRNQPPAERTYFVRKPTKLHPLSLARVPSLVQNPTLWLAAFAIAWVLWEIVARALVRSPLLMPTPEMTMQAAWSMYVTDHDIYPHLLTSSKEAAIGFALALSGIPLGLLIGSSKRAMTMLEPFNAAMYALPHIALVPMTIVWFGLSVWAPVFIVFISCFFVILINTESGVVTVDSELSDVAKSFGSSRVHRFFTLTVPGTVPFIIVGVKLGVGRALVGVVAVEMFAANEGLGFLLSRYGDLFQTARMFVIIATFAVAGALLMVLAGALGRPFERWRID